MITQDPMPDERTNLLPLERRRALRRDYFMRLGVVVAAFAATLSLTAAILLVPTYVFLVKSAAAEKARLASIESAISSSGEAALSARLTALSDDTKALSALASARSVSEVMRAALEISRPGISLSGFAYEPGASGNRSALAISGTAMTRDALRKYQLALQHAPFVRAADLPVSAYAKDSAIAFTIAVTLAP